MTRPARADERLRLCASAVYRTIDAREGCLLDVEQRVFFSTNAAGAFLLERLSRGARRAALVAAFARRFRLTAQRAARDVDSFLAQLRRRKLITPAVGAGRRRAGSGGRRRRRKERPALDVG